MTWVSWTLVVVFVAAIAALGYGWFEAGWVRTRVLVVPIRELPAELDGLRIGHLSDFHLGMIGRGRVASTRAVAWVAEREPDIVCVTGDLVSHPRGEPLLRALLGQLGRPYVVLGNHDVAITKDPFSRAAELDDLREAVLLRDEAVETTVRGARVQIVGVDPASYTTEAADPWRSADPTAAFRILLCHFPGIVRRHSNRAFDLILTGHHHAGQIAIPYPGGKLALAHPRAGDLVGLIATACGPMHVSPGLGTSLLPIRFFARPEVTELILRPAQ
ncbi:MAG: metallophosphoesterase [Gaiellaceae bacterium]